MLMFGKENDQDKNIWKSTIIIRKKHFLNMVKKYYKDIMVASFMRILMIQMSLTENIK